MDLRARQFLIQILILPLPSYVIWVIYYWAYLLLWKTGIISGKGSE